VSLLESRTFSFWIVLRPSKDLEGVWVSHCLELDAVSQGASPAEAFEAAQEAAELIVLDDLARGVDPLLRRAPDRFFDVIDSLLASGERIPLDRALTEGDRLCVIAAPIELKIRAHTVEDEEAETEPAWRAPPVSFREALELAGCGG